MYRYNLGISFYENSERYAENSAIIFDLSEKYSYSELNKLSNKIARYLRNKGISSGDVVCITGEKTIHSYSTILACLKIGAVYSVFDPESPFERLKKIFDRCLPKIICTGKERDLNHLLSNELLEYNEVFFSELKNLDHDNLSETIKVTGEDPAYIMFTSGSTGFPKGAVMTHDNVLNLIEWSTKTYGFSQGDILTNLNPLYFDNSVFDFYAALFSGASLVPFSKKQTTDPKLLVDRLDSLQCTSLFSVPSLLIFLQTMKAFMPEKLKYVKRIIFGGEGYPKAKLKNIFDLYSDRINFYNVYGPTECTCICSTYKVSAMDFTDLTGFLPLGELAENFSFLIVDEKNEIVENGQTGELYLKGPQVGKGYYNDPERTQSSFIQNPHCKYYKEIMYKTGDLVFYNKLDNKIYINGRKDNQVKHMGYRIELEEIENALSCVNNVNQAIVVHTINNGFSHLFAFISSSKPLEEMELRNELLKIIPAYMLPTRYYFVDTLPKNANGKVDRKILLTSVVKL
jgi:D-alanine--poly(phosphoribitol) ligase subunit 1